MGGQKRIDEYRFQDVVIQKYIEILAYSSVQDYFILFNINDIKYVKFFRKKLSKNYKIIIQISNIYHQYHPIYYYLLIN